MGARYLRHLPLGFALLATVPAQDLVQVAQGPANAWVYGALTSLEEGTEIAAALLLLAATRGGLRPFGASRPEPFVCFVIFAAPLLWLYAGALPLAAAATYALNLTGASNWLGATLFLSCALLALRAAAQGDATPVARSGPRVCVRSVAPASFPCARRAYVARSLPRAAPATGLVDVAADGCAAVLFHRDRGRRPVRRRLRRRKARIAVANRAGATDTQLAGS